MDAKELKVNYDPKEDVAYFSFGQPREALSCEIEEGMILRIDPETNSLIGITVVDFIKRFQKEPGRSISIPTDADCISQPV